MNPLLIDEPHARAGLFRGPVAPGTFVAAAAVGLGSVDVPQPATVGMVGMSWRFLRPVRPGDTIQSRWRLFRKRSVENPEWGLAFWHVEVLDAEGQRLAEGEVSRLVARRTAGAPAAVETTAARSRRRRRRGGSAERVTEVVESAPLPEPAPADAPSPSRRRRRRGGGNRNGGAPRAEAAPEPSAEPPPAAAKRPSGLGGVLRRLRGS